MAMAPSSTSSHRQYLGILEGFAVNFYMSVLWSTRYFNVPLPVLHLSEIYITVNKA